MRISFLKAIISMSSVLVLASVLLAQTGQQNVAGKTKSVEPAPKRDIYRDWVRQPGNPSLSSIHSLTGVARGPSYRRHAPSDGLGPGEVRFQQAWLRNPSAAGRK